MTERPLVPETVIVDALENIEIAMVTAQLDAIAAEKDRLMVSALPMVEAQDTAGISALTWNAAVALQPALYQTWSDGFALGGEHMKLAVRAAIPSSDRAQFMLSHSGTPEYYALSPDVAQLLTQFFELEPGQLVASAVQSAVLNRVLNLAGNFARSQLNALKTDLLAAILPQPTTGNPISRDDLLKRIQNTLSVGSVRATNIARTELTNAYNRGRVAMGLRSTLVEAFRFIAILDTRTTEICRSRDGMIIAANDTVGLAGNTPSMHYMCRSTLSPVLPRVNSQHAAWLADPQRRRQNRELAALLPGWT